MTRREFIGGTAAVALGSRIRSSNAQATTLTKHGDDPTQFVNIAIGTGGHGHTYPGATVPFGMVQLSPDTDFRGWDWCSGYHLSDASIMGFSHSHLSGTGCADLLDFLLMPGTGETKIIPGPQDHSEQGYRSRFRHETEIRETGYYSVLLDDYKIRAELTATERAGFHRYTFPESESSHVILDLAHPYGDTSEHAARAIHWAQLKVASHDTIVGGRSTAAWADGRQLYFAMQFSKPFRSAEIFVEHQLVTGAGEVRGKSIKCVLHFDTHKGEIIQVKTGISGVDIDGALRNVDHEIPDWNFDRIRAQARSTWQSELSRISVEAEDRRHKEIFYTGLYHLLIAPTLFDDVDGRYRGMDQKIHQLGPGQHNYSTFSLWDTFRAVHPLYALIEPERVPAMVNCLIRMGEESPEGMPVWPLHGIETGCMTGYHSAAVIAEASAKGFDGIDYRRAFQVLRKRAMRDDYRGLGLYRRLGYIPADREEESVSKAMEYAYDDWAVARVAFAIGKKEEAEQLLARSRNYRNLFDQKTQFIRPRLENGDWAEPFDPRGMGHSKRWRDFTECNAWQATFGIQHDVPGYIELFGGREKFIAKLDALFEQSSELPPDAPPDIAGLVGQYAHGNEPSHHIAYLYAYAGQPWKTQARVRSLLEVMYSNQPDGIAGNEDCGQMSAWYVISALGFYAVDPVSGNYVFGTPLSDRAVVDLGKGKQFIVEAHRASPDHVYIQSIEWNGQLYDKTWFHHSDVQDGAHIRFHLGPQPNLKFGANKNAVPPGINL